MRSGSTASRWRAARRGRSPTRSTARGTCRGSSSSRSRFRTIIAATCTRTTWASWWSCREIGSRDSTCWWAAAWAAPTARRTPIRGSDRKSTRLNSSHSQNSYAVFCLKKKKNGLHHPPGEPDGLFEVFQLHRGSELRPHRVSHHRRRQPFAHHVAERECDHVLICLIPV